MHQNIQWIRIKLCRLNNLSSTSVTLVPQFVGFSGLLRWTKDKNHAISVVGRQFVGLHLRDPLLVTETDRPTNYRSRTEPDLTIIGRNANGDVLSPIDTGPVI